MRQIPLLRPFFDKDEINEIKSVLDSGWVSQGPKVSEFEGKIAGASAVAAGSIVVYHSPAKWVLINFPKRKELAKVLD